MCTYMLASAVSHYCHGLSRGASKAFPVDLIYRPWEIFALPIVQPFFRSRKVNSAIRTVKLLNVLIFAREELSTLYEYPY